MTRCSARLGISLAMLLGVLGCASAPTSPHPHDVVLTEGSRYEKNPDVKLRREYWIIIVAADETRAMVPRPDGDPRIVEECKSGSGLAATFAAARLCENANQSTLARVNALSRAEAFQVSSFLHERLRFQANEAEGRVEPHALTSDVVDLCKAFAADRQGPLRALCDRELGYADRGERPAIYIPYTAEESRVIAGRLNEMYGIP